MFPARELIPYLMSSKDFMALNLGRDLFYHWGSQKSYLGSGYLVTFLSVVSGRVFGESPLFRIECPRIHWSGGSGHRKHSRYPIFSCVIESRLEIQTK